MSDQPAAVSYRAKVAYSPDGSDDAFPWKATVLAVTGGDPDPVAIRIFYRQTRAEAERAAREHVAWLREQPAQDEGTWLEL